MAGLARASRFAFTNCTNSMKNVLMQPQVAGISSKVIRDLDGIKRPPPFDYKNKTYNIIRAIWDRTHERIDENSVVISVEGPIACGKTAFAEKLAADLDLLYWPQETMDLLYINNYGSDLRQYDDQLSEFAKSFDEKKFLAKPNHIRVASFQLQMYQLRFAEYMKALTHLLSTGQGVVKERTPYTDRVFLDTLNKCNLISKDAYGALIETHANSLHELVRPHLIIYLDVPVKQTLENIKKRNKWGEASSPLFKDTKFLEAMEEAYKIDFLRRHEPYSEILVYDWSTGGDSEVVVEDIMKIDMTRYKNYDLKLADWRALDLPSDWNELRMKYQKLAYEVFQSTVLPLYHVPELTIHPDDYIPMSRAYLRDPGSTYAYGYNKAMGDKDILTKFKEIHPPRQKNSYMF